jgi:predicted dehydrogenase
MKKQEDEFIFSVAFLNHGHIYGMTKGLIEAGARLKYVYDDNAERVAKFVEQYPMVTPVDSFEKILEDTDTQLIASAAITCERSDIGCRVMESKKDYFTDKAPFTTLEQIARAKRVVKATQQKYMVYYSEYLHVESAVYAKQLIDEGAIGQVIQVLGLGPHRLNAPSRPDWFFLKEKYGGILCDIGSHQIYQFLIFADVHKAKVVSSQVGNYNHPMYPELEDYGDANLVSDQGSTMYFRVDWFTPDGLSTWGDGRTVILGTEGYIELRKYVDIAKDPRGNHVYLVNKNGEQYMNVEGKVGFPFFRQLIFDCINRTEEAMSQDRAFLASELAIQAQIQAQVIR